MKKGIIIVVVLSLIISGAALLLALSSHSLLAQIGSNSGTTPSQNISSENPDASDPSAPVIVYLVNPDTSGITSRVIGQTLFTLQFAGYNDLNIPQDANIEIIGDKTGMMFCTEKNHFFDSTTARWTWTMRCDTMSFINSTYQVKIHAYFSNGAEINLVKDSSTNYTDPVFGPILIDNIYTFSSPANGSAVKGVINIKAALSGVVQRLTFKITSLSNDRQISLPAELLGELLWQASWDTKLNDDGHYRLEMQIITLNQTELLLDNQIMVKVENNFSPPTCTPSWHCGDWSACTSAGGQTRTCLDINNCGSAEGQPVLEQRCAPPAENTNINANVNINNNQNNQANLNTNNTNKGVNNNTNAGTPAPETKAPPVAVMVSPKANDVITGLINLSAKVEGQIKYLDFFWDLAGGTAPANKNVLIGAGRTVENNPNVWAGTWDTLRIPEGDYFVYARLQGLDGNKYLSNKVAVRISRQSKTAKPPAETAETPASNDDDNDSLPNAEEAKLGSNPNSPDTNDNGIPDGEEVLNEKNPSNTGSLNSLVETGKLSSEEMKNIREKIRQIAFEQPTKSGTAAPEKLKVLEVENIISDLGQNNLVFKGQGPPNAYVSLFIYSTPIVVTTKTDASGNFTYTLDKNLLDGEHEVYVTVTDETGKIMEKSAPLAFFVRKAQAVSEEDYLRGDVNVTSESKTELSKFLFIAIGIVLIVVLIFVLVYLNSRKNKMA